MSGQIREQMTKAKSRSATEPLLVARDLVKHFTVGSETVQAVDGVSLSLAQGETLGIVGESGCGKSTLARLLVRLLKPTEGSIVLDGIDISRMSMREMRSVRRQVQMVFQDPRSSLNRRMTIGDAIEEPRRIHRRELDQEPLPTVAELLETVGLNRRHADRYPQELSGGERQRACIARALSIQPKVLVLDEPVSSLDVSVQAQILNLLGDLRDELGLSYVFIAHDLAVVRYLAQRVAVMYLGQIVEVGTAKHVFDNPRHPYTQALLESVPIPDPTRRLPEPPLVGDVPSPMNPPSGCRFHTRCPLRIQLDNPAICATVAPILADGEQVACHFTDDAAASWSGAAR